MNNNIDKPKRSAVDLVAMLRDEKGVAFNLIDEETAAEYLCSHNNYLRTAAYRKNYEKHAFGPDSGKYISLDFAYLIELSKIDMYLRAILLQMCINIEHALKVAVVSDIEVNPKEDGYSIVNDFLSQNKDISNSIGGKSDSIFTGDLISKYFDLCYVFEGDFAVKTEILSVDCPAWVLVEILAFRDFLRFIEFYNNKYPGRISIDIKMLNTVRSLRNACAHNNCILFSMRPGSTRPNAKVSQCVARIPSIGKEERKNKLSCRPLFEIVCLLEQYNSLVSEKVRKKGILELKKFVDGRMFDNFEYFKDNQVISTSFLFVKKVVDFFA